MSNVVELGGDGGRDQQRSIAASTWIAKLDKGLSNADTEELRAWMQADSRNEAELLSMAEMWDKMDALARLSEVFPHAEGESASNALNNFRRIALAASVAIVALAGLMVIFGPADMNRELDASLVADVAMYETAIGGISKVELSDGSSITLNTNSRVEVSFNEHQRVIKLERGEIHIDVAHDPSRPLSVIVGGRVVQAVGTAFSVKIDDSQRVEILVADGRVKVGIQAKGNSSVEGSSEGAANEIAGDALLISQGERVVLDDSSEELEVLEPEEIEVELSWREGNLVFRGESLADAAAEISRYTPVEFVILDEDLQRRRVGGFFKAGDVAGFLDQLRTNFNIVYERVDDQTILLSEHKDASN